MADAEVVSPRTDCSGRPFVCEARSPDGRWHVQVFGPSVYHNGLYADARHPERGAWFFGVGGEPAGADRIRFKWDLPNDSWGIFIDGECWAVYTRRSARRTGACRVHSRSGPHARPFTADELRFAWAKRRGQRPGTRGFVIEE